jgi:hypothetical protein
MMPLTSATGAVPFQQVGTARSRMTPLTSPFHQVTITCTRTMPLTSKVLIARAPAPEVN